MKKALVPLSGVILCLVGLALVFAPSWIGLPSGPITMAVAIEESTDSPTYLEQTHVMLGTYAQELRKANKWRQFDDDEVPADYTYLLDKRQSKEPWLFLLHGKSITNSGPVPKTNDGLKEAVENAGGY